MNIAIIGTGIAGMGCGHFLQKNYNLTFFEQNSYVGGHTNTAYVEETIPVDTGFIVFNDITYPNLIRLFKRLNVDTYNTDMSFSVQHLPSALEYCGSSLDKIFAQRKNIFNPKFIRFILEIERFNKECTKILDNPVYEKYSMLDYVREEKFSEDFLYKYLAPMSSALWSTPTDITVKFPAVALVRFFKNHGLLGLSTQYQWKTVRNGSWQYRDKVIAPFKDKIKINTKVEKVVRLEGGKVKVYTNRGEELEFDKVIFACHADQALALLESPSPLEKSLLSNFEYQKNIATLHTDASLMPKLKKTWSSWNYRIEKVNNELVAHTIYYMNKLQEISSKSDYFLSINQPNTVDPKKVVKTIEYEHPIFTPEAYKAQAELHKLNNNGQVYFCGSYFKYGFHEDAFTSAVNLCTKLTGKDAWEN
ncbi:MAG TPA: FAD-dependent oxidoreductase [Cytophagaceae bacterium]|nr:FAD-dependent oxidoreductase [Cytophagaceae bacterium]